MAIKSNLKSRCAFQGKCPGQLLADNGVLSLLSRDLKIFSTQVANDVHSLRGEASQLISWHTRGMKRNPGPRCPFVSPSLLSFLNEERPALY